MFLVRSAFWLTVAFIALHPRDVDLGAAASALSDKAIAAGQQIVIDRVLKADCLPIRCAAPGASAPARLAADIAATPAAAAPRDLSISRPAPVPRPRPDWMG